MVTVDGQPKLRNYRLLSARRFIMNLCTRRGGSALFCFLSVMPSYAGEISLGWNFSKAGLRNISGFEIFFGSASGVYNTTPQDVTDYHKASCPRQPILAHIVPLTSFSTGDCAPPTDPFPPRYYIAVKAFRGDTSRIESTYYSNEISGFPHPKINTFNPPSAAQGDPPVTLNVTGINFLPSTYINLYTSSGAVVRGLNAWSSASDCQHVSATFELGGAVKDGSAYAQVGHHKVSANQLDLGCGESNIDPCSELVSGCTIFGKSSGDFDILFRPWLADIDGNGMVDDLDKNFVVARFGQKVTDAAAQADLANWNRANLDGNDIIDGGDLAFIYYYMVNFAGQSITFDSPAPSPSATNAALTRAKAWGGDVNHDGVVDARDARLITRYYWGRRTPVRRIPPFQHPTRHIEGSRPVVRPSVLRPKNPTLGNHFVQMVTQLIDKADQSPKFLKPSDAPPMKGDLNEDGRIDGEDLSLLVRFLGRNRENLYEGKKVRVINDWILFDRSDLDRDGAVTNADLKIFRNIFNGKPIEEKIVVQDLESFVRFTWLSEQEKMSSALSPRLQIMLEKLGRIEGGEPYMFPLDLNMDRKVSGADVALIVWKEMPEWFKKTYEISELPDLPEHPEIYFGRQAQ